MKKALIITGVILPAYIIHQKEYEYAQKNPQLLDPWWTRRMFTCMLGFNEGDDEKLEGYFYAPIWLLPKENIKKSMLSQPTVSDIHMESDMIRFSIPQDPKGTILKVSLAWKKDSHWTGTAVKEEDTGNTTYFVSALVQSVPQNFLPIF